MCAHCNCKKPKQNLKPRYASKMSYSGVTNLKKTPTTLSTVSKFTGSSGNYP